MMARVNDIAGNQPPSADPPEKQSVLPTVRRPRSGLSGLAIGIGAAVCAVILFVVLDSRRRALSAPAVTVRSTDIGGASAAPPPLYIPPVAEPRPPYLLARAFEPAEPAPPPERVQPVAPPAQQPVIVQPAPAIIVAPDPPPRVAGGSALVFDASGRSLQQATPSDAASEPTGSPVLANATGRARAASIANRSTTVSQGTLIPAVLETGFNSSGPGFARALVQRDIYSFDGTRVLIPRGSRLIGEYGADAAPGQKRALIAWSRLIRPDGVTIALGSPATDPVGRGGIRAKVDTHFFERFGGALLQSVLDVGVNLASRSSNSPVIVALPGSLQGSSVSSAQPAQIPRTLSVERGASVSVFVARDLDFTDVEARR
jgi:type IV secretion system protein VirB10